MTKNKNVKIIFSDANFKQESGPKTKGLMKKKVKEFATGVDDIVQWFDKYQIDSIELWIKGGAETGDLVKLFVSAKGEGGIKVTLRPKNQ